MAWPGCCAAAVSNARFTAARAAVMGAAAVAEYQAANPVAVFRRQPGQQGGSTGDGITGLRTIAGGVRAFRALDSVSQWHILSV